jgi:hypothetical protein
MDRVLTPELKRRIERLQTVAGNLRDEIRRELDGTGSHDAGEDAGEEDVGGDSPETPRREDSDHDN